MKNDEYYNEDFYDMPTTNHSSFNQEEWKIPIGERKKNKKKCVRSVMNAVIVLVCGKSFSFHHCGEK